ncbi:DUF3515 domain-containing protein [Streptomyces genisteinicus]|uniref:DUF3515 domain-containing protein n=1 Tax=Streptomyces genisteinicus TaxID=2768068 RepID=A0A7H0HY97_9ACTN|nr:DUF3515 domain-containing protein [Streptomyces genisteinicus]QNP65513.1 DUF3515 domain-containing protein [Streptomyces genisteinicus]
MTSFARRSLALSAAVLALAAAAGCSPGDAAAQVPVPSPPAQEAALCGALHDALPDSVAGHGRQDPEPSSELTAGWGDAAIVLRCGVPRPDRMSDPQAQGIEVDGVGWMLEERDSGPRFTTTYRETYVEVTLGEDFLHDASPLTELAGPVARTVPATL